MMNFKSGWNDMEYIEGFFPNRYVCSVIDEQKELLQALNKRTLARYKEIIPHLLAEMQYHVNRMEAALNDANDVSSIRETKRKLKQEVKELQKAIKIVKPRKKHDK